MLRSNKAIQLIHSDKRMIFQRFHHITKMFLHFTLLVCFLAPSLTEGTTSLIFILNFLFLTMRDYCEDCLPLNHFKNLESVNVVLHFRSLELRPAHESFDLIKFTEHKFFSIQFTRTIFTVKIKTLKTRKLNCSCNWETMTMNVFNFTTPVESHIIIFISAGYTFLYECGG